jgi:hypothetical protein
MVYPRNNETYNFAEVLYHDVFSLLLKWAALEEIFVNLINLWSFVLTPIGQDSWNLHVNLVAQILHIKFEQRIEWGYQKEVRNVDHTYEIVHCSSPRIFYRPES